MKLYFAAGACSLSPHIVAEEADVPVRLLLFPGSLEPGDHRDQKGQAGHQAEQHGLDQEGAVEIVALIGLVDIGSDDGDGSAIDEDRDIGLRVE